MQIDTNNDRATRARKALDAYLPDDIDSGEQIADLLCDLQHLADTLGTDWAYITERAQDHYDAETETTTTTQE